MDESIESLNDDYSLNTSLFPTTSFHEEQPSSSNSVPKQKKAVDNCVPWRFCLSQLQKCKDPKNRAQFKKLIGKYSQTHFLQRKTDTLAKAKQIWPDLEERYGDLTENWTNIEADLIARENYPYAFVNILVKADPSTGASCRALRRINGVCRGHHEYDVRELKDPRTKTIRIPRTVPLLIPKYPLDDYIAFAPPRREIAFVELNDNVKEDYLREFCCARGKRELVYLQIYKHPSTGGHLGMALVEFKTSDQAMDFYRQCGSNTKIMGFDSKIFVDTLGFWITDEYTRLTETEPATLPPRRAFFKKPEEIARIRELIRLQNIKDDVFDNQNSSNILTPSEEAPKPTGARTPLGLPNSSSASVNSLSRSASRESIESVKSKQADRQSPVREETNPSVNGHARRRKSRSPSRSRSSRDYRRQNGTSRRRDEYESRSYRDRNDRNYGTKRRMDSSNDRRVSKYRRRRFSISPDRTKSSYRSNRKRSVSSSSTRSGSSESYKNRPKRANRERSVSQSRQTEKPSELTGSTDTINLSIQPPPAPFSFPPPFFPFFSAPIPPSSQNCIDSIPDIPENAIASVKTVQREVGPYYVTNHADLLTLLRQMRISGHYNQSSVFVVPTLRLYEEPICSFVLTDFFVEFEKQKGPTPFDPRLIAIEKVKEDLKNDLLASLKANMCQHIETLMYKEVDRLHIEYEAKQKVLNEERLKTKRPETKQIFDFEEQFSNASGMGTKSVFGSNRMWQLNRNILSTKKIPKKNADGHVKGHKEGRKKSIEAKTARKENKNKSKSPTKHVGSRISSTSPIKKSPRSRSSSTSSSSASSSSSDVSDTENAPKKTSVEASGSSALSSPTNSLKTSFKKESDIQSLQITQSRTLRKVDYCEDDSTDSEAGDSDWAEQFGIGNEPKERKKKLHKKHRETEQTTKVASSPSSIEDENSQIAAQTTEIEPISIKDEPEKEFPIEFTPKSPPVEAEIEPNLITIKEEAIQEVEVKQEVIIEKPVQLPKPKVIKPKVIELPKEKVQLYPNVRFNYRSIDEETRLLFDFLDEEDAHFVMLASQNKKVSITQMSEGEPIKRPIFFLNSFTANADLPAIPPSPKTSKSGSHRRNSAYLDLPCIGASEGAARLVPYSRGKFKDEKSSSINYGFIEVTSKDEKAARNKQEKRRELRALQRNLVSTVGDCQIVRQNVFKFREKMLKFARSGIHGWGLFTLEDIQPNDMIIEYVGEVIRPTIADVREFNYTRRGIGSSYLFRMNDDSVVDATGKGNVARFINHSCNPNCFARVIGKLEQSSICIYAKRFIRRGEEITYDYQFPIEDTKIPCHCGAPLCRQYLN